MALDAEPADGHRAAPQVAGHVYRSVGRNCNLLLNATPGPDGLIPETNLRHYAKFGRAIRRRFATPLGETSGEGEVVELKLPRIQRVDHVVVTWIAYCLPGWIFLDLVKSFRVTSFAPLCPCGAVYGWVAEGFEYRRMAR